MERALILETSFLIDLEREHNRGTPGSRGGSSSRPIADANLYLPFVVAGELAAGAVDGPPRRGGKRSSRRSICCRTRPDVSWEFGRAYRHLRGTGQLIGTNDLWIAATALAYEMPVVTDNVEHFRRVPHLEVEPY